ncbi:hypothetical protein GJ744_001207 [Endocarpon pusillum]|uniref:1-alkyl-2-acetylglycerophosphocholine esterase n=1 Tax=Endocarpon pusillum TaxID=364733 RepID=A0A8H7ADK0_9EURO|nr:hypothetical protein GJ744_001207 [Endocarpon pusillum]
MKTPMLTITSATFLASLASLATGITIPIPSGRYGVDSSVVELIDTARLDPYAPTPQPRRLMLSVFYPSGSKEDCQQYLSSYMPATTAALHDTLFSSFGIPNGTFETLGLSLCHAKPASTSSNHYPTVLFSPGLGGSRLLYSALAQTLSSHGFTVLTIDHPYDASIVSYPDGTFVLAANISTDAQITRAVAIRAADVSFTIQSLQHNQHLFNFQAPNSKDILIFGHSLGGATALSVLLSYPTLIRGAINLDGRIFGPSLSQATHRPFLLFGHEGKNQSTDSSWATTWPHLLGSKLELSLLGSQHVTFGDFPILADVLGLRTQMPDAIDAVLGRIDGTRALDVITTYVQAFFKFAIGHAASDILTQPRPAYPEIEVVEADL